jgi:hypothetical protein
MIGIFIHQITAADELNRDEDISIIFSNLWFKSHHIFILLNSLWDLLKKSIQIVRITELWWDFEWFSSYTLRTMKFSFSIWRKWEYRCRQSYQIAAANEFNRDEDISMIFVNLWFKSHDLFILLYNCWDWSKNQFKLFKSLTYYEISNDFPPLHVVLCNLVSLYD